MSWNAFVDIFATETAAGAISRWVRLRPEHPYVLVYTPSKCIPDSIGARLHVECHEHPVSHPFLIRLRLKFGSFTASRHFSSPAQPPAMRILLLGSGGREHALVWKLFQSTAVETIFLAPGNGGSYQQQKLINVGLSIADSPALVQFATENEVRPRSLRPARP
jgi:hypothetical protein